MTAPEAQGTSRWDSSWLALILAFAFAFRFAQLDGLAPFIDESADVVLSLDYQSWDVWSRLLHGKLLGYLWFKPILLLAWDPLYAARLFAALAGMASVALTYGLLLTLASRRAALVGAAFLAFLPIVVFHDRLALFDGLMVAAVTAGVLLYVRGGTDRPLTLLTAGFLFGVALFTKAYASLAILLWFPILRRQSVRHSRAVLLAGLGLLVCVLITGLFLAVQLKEGERNLQAALSVPSRFLAPDLSAGQRAGLALRQLGEVFDYLRGYNGWAFFPVVLLAGFLPGSRWKLRLELLATWLLSCLILAAAFQFFFSRYLLLTLPVLALLVALVVDDCMATVRTTSRRIKNNWLPLTALLLLALCGLDFVYRDTLIAAQVFSRVLPARDAYQYLWGGPSGFGLREVADKLREVDLTDDRKVICVTRGMGTGTHGAATLPLLLRHAPIRFVHVWLKSNADIQLVRDLPKHSRVVVFVDDPQFLNRQVLAQLNAQPRLLFEIRGTTGRPDYRLFELVR
jgi:4-amino-4-deoxy-L-arabinose transferase-like glycosyltransferase